MLPSNPVITALFAVFFVETFANHRSLIAHRSPRRIDYHPVNPSAVSGHEYRGSGHGINDYISYGVGGIVSLVTKEYGLRNSESFYWGQSGNPTANLTAYTAGEEVRVLSMERFNDVLMAADCSTNSIKLTFTQEVEFDQVQDAWGWVNSADANYIVLVTENARCNIADGDPTVRQPWHVTSAQFDDTTNVVTLTAESKTWSEAFSDWRLKLNTRGLLPQGPRGINKRLTISADPSIDLSQDFSGLGFEMEDEGGSDVTGSVSCDPCYTSGSIDFDIDIVPYPLEARLGGTFSVVASGVGASLTAKTSISGELSGAQGLDEIFEWAPDGIAIKDVVEIGPVVKVDVAAGIGGVDAAVELSTGVEITIPDNSIYYLNLDDESQDVTSGWTPEFSPLPPEMSSSISIEANVGTQLRLELDLSVLGSGAAAGFILAAPTLAIGATGTVEEDACEVPGAVAGVELDVGLEASLQAFEAASLLGFGTTAYQTIVGTSMDLYSTCMTMASVPALPSGSAAAPNGTAAPLPSGFYSSPASGSALPSSSYAISSSGYAVASSGQSGYFSSYAESVAPLSSYAIPSSSQQGGSSSYRAYSTSYPAPASSYSAHHVSSSAPPYPYSGRSSSKPPYPTAY